MREIKEEIGLDVSPLDLKPFLEYKRSSIPHPGFVNNGFFNSYIVRTNKTIDDMTMQKEEISELKFVPFQEFKQMVAENNKELVSHPQEYKDLIDLLEPEFGSKSTSKF